MLLVNREPTPLDGIADAVVHGEIGAVLRALVGANGRGENGRGDDG